MIPDRPTIFALSSGRPPAAVAVIRISGPGARIALEKMIGRVPQPRRASLAKVRDPASGEVIDEGLALWFPGPHSETGEDMTELQVHGGRAVIAAVLAGLGRLDGFRHAEAGEFTRRAFENGKLDLTEAEGLADLIAAETEQQRRLAQRQLAGELKDLYERWRADLIQALARLEATIDFVDEDLPAGLLADVRERVDRLSRELGAHAADNRRGEIVRDGFTVVILGAPNVGKSSLLNALARRDVAIVSAIPGTTRDAIEVDLDLGGYAVTLIDTAGLRETRDEIESEGIRRARQKAAHADLRLGVVDASAKDDSRATNELGKDDAVLLNKSDLAADHHVPEVWAKDGSPLTVMRISAKTGQGIDELLAWLEARVIEAAGAIDAMPMTRARHRAALAEAQAALARVPASLGARTIDLAAEDLRLAARALGRITGRVDVEDLLDVIFREFCIGK
jgi:tRNA modification GTPase